MAAEATETAQSTETPEFNVYDALKTSLEAGADFVNNTTPEEEENLRSQTTPGTEEPADPPEGQAGSSTDTGSPPAEEEPPAEQEPPAEEEPPAEQEPPATPEIPAEVLNQHLQTVLGVDNLDELTGILAEADKNQLRVAELEGQLEEAKKATPTFQNDLQQKIYDHLGRLTDEVSLEEGLLSYVRLVSLDTASLDHKTALQEMFVLENPTLSRAEAEELFQEDYYERFELNQTRAAEIRLKLEGEKAIRQLKEKQAAAKAAPAKAAEKPAEKPAEPAAVPAEITASIDKHVTDFRAALQGFNQLEFTADQEKFVYSLKPDKIAELDRAMTAHLSNPNSYDKDGTLKGGLNAQETRNQLAIALNYQDVIQHAIKQGIHIGVERQVKKTQGQQPTRQSSAGQGATKPKTDAEIRRDAILAMPPV